LVDRDLANNVSHLLHMKTYSQGARIKDTRQSYSQFWVQIHSF